MSKYIVFAWSPEAKKTDAMQADEMLGTSTTVQKIEQEYLADQYGEQFGFKMVTQPVTLAPHLMLGKTLDMEVLVTWGAEGEENAHPIVAYLEIPNG